MTTINNLTIEQMREIVKGAPEGATHIAGSAYLKLIGAAWWQGWLLEWNEDANCMVRIWKGESIELMETWGKVLKLNDLRTAIAEHDNTDIGTEIDSFLDAFKSPELTDDRKEELTQDWKGMSGGVAFSLIERHADNWKEIDYMMNQWLEANKEAERHG